LRQALRNERVGDEGTKRLHERIRVPFELTGATLPGGKMIHGEYVTGKAWMSLPTGTVAPHTCYTFKIKSFSKIYSAKVDLNYRVERVSDRSREKRSCQASQNLLNARNMQRAWTDMDINGDRSDAYWKGWQPAEQSMARWRVRELIYKTMI